MIKHTKNQTKMCNKCGELTNNYNVVDNAIICKNCSEEEDEET